MEDDGVRSCLIELQSFPLRQAVHRPNTPYLGVFSLLLVRCKTWFGHIKLLRIFDDCYAWDSRLQRIPSVFPC